MDTIRGTVIIQEVGESCNFAGDAFGVAVASPAGVAVVQVYSVDDNREKAGPSAALAFARFGRDDNVGV
jgi:hypothetical protein